MDKRGEDVLFGPCECWVVVQVGMYVVCVCVHVFIVVYVCVCVHLFVFV